MLKGVLVVDGDEDRRRELVYALSRRGLRYLDVDDAFAAMGAVGRADFGAIIASEGRRTLSLRGLCQLARKHHDGIRVFVLRGGDSERKDFSALLGMPVDAIAPGTKADKVAATVEDALTGAGGTPEDLGWDEPTDAMRVAMDEPKARSAQAKTSAKSAGKAGSGASGAAAARPASKSSGAAPASSSSSSSSRTNSTGAEAGTGQPAGIQAPRQQHTDVADLFDETAPALPSPSATPAHAPIEPVAKTPAPVAEAVPQVVPEQISVSAALTEATPPLAESAPVQAGAIDTFSESAHTEPVTHSSPVAVPATTAVNEFAPTLENLQPAPSPPLLEGQIDAGMGPGLLLAIFAQQLTGRLTIKNGEQSGTLFFYRGDPVWAEDATGDAGLHRRLVHSQRIAADAVLASVDEGTLLGSLVQAGQLTPQQMHEFMRDFVRDLTLGIITTVSAEYRFDEDLQFLEVEPLFRVNPFGLVFESRRKSLEPSELMAIAKELEGKFMIPGPTLAAASEKLAPFVRSARLADIVDGTKTVGQVIQLVQLDQLMGTLVVLSLRDTSLVSLEQFARATDAGGVTLLERPGLKAP